MGYVVGVDLGTTFTAAAVARDGAPPAMVDLGTRSAAVPTVVALEQEGGFAVGDTARRRAATDPGRVAREFKRRVGDTIPVLVGGQPWSPEALLGVVLGWVLARIAEREGGPPDAVVVTHPANWGPLRRELLEQAAATAGGVRATFVTEPEAAAVHYASAERIADGTVVAVYDLGGGTFDATVLRKVGDGFEVLGRPEGIERLGGLDIDAALLGHVTAGLGSAWTGLDPDDATDRLNAARLRDEIVSAKEALSEEPDVSVPVQLQGLTTEVRVTRSELEALVAPMIQQSVDALATAIDGAGLTPSDVDRILLIGGSSRMPLVSQLLASRFDRPLALDTHPKHAVALGAALLASGGGAVGAATGAPLLARAPSTPTPTKRPWRVAAIAVAAVVLLAAGTAFALAGGDDGGGGGGGEQDDLEASGATTTTAVTSTTAADENEFCSAVSRLDLEIDGGSLGNAEGIATMTSIVADIVELAPTDTESEAALQVRGAVTNADPANPQASGPVVATFAAPLFEVCGVDAPPTSAPGVPTAGTGPPPEALAMARESFQIDAVRLSCSEGDCPPPTDAQANPFGEDRMSGPLRVDCNADGCSMGIIFNPTAPIVQEEDGTLVATGALTSGSGIRCAGIADPTTFTITMDVILDGDTMASASGQIVVTADEATNISDCGTRSRTFDYTISRAG